MICGVTYRFSEGSVFGVESRGVRGFLVHLQFSLLRSLLPRLPSLPLPQREQLALRRHDERIPSLSPVRLPRLSDGVWTLVSGGWDWRERNVFGEARARSRFSDLMTHSELCRGTPCKSQTFVRLIHFTRFMWRYGGRRSDSGSSSHDCSDERVSVTKTTPKPRP